MALQSLEKSGTHPGEGYQTLACTLNFSKLAKKVNEKIYLNLCIQNIILKYMTT